MKASYHGWSRDPAEVDHDEYSKPYVDGWSRLKTRLGVVAGYESLAVVLDDALHQAQSGKGKERHSSGEPFEEQPIVSICEDLGSPQFAIGQARKKSREALRLPYDRARAELLGAINYLSAAVIVLDRANRAVKADDVAISHYGGDAYDPALTPDPKAKK